MWCEWCVHDDDNNNLNPHSIQKMIHWCSIIIIIMSAVPCNSKSSNETMMMNHIQSVLFKQMILHKIFRLIFFIYWTQKHRVIGHRSMNIGWVSFWKSFTLCHSFPEQISSAHEVFLWIPIQKLNRLSYSSSELILFFFWSHWLCLRLTHHICNCAKAIQKVLFTLTMIRHIPNDDDTIR